MLSCRRSRSFGERQESRHKKAPGEAGAFCLMSLVGSVTETTDNRSTPVEAINQRGADGLNQRMEGDGVACQRVGSINQLVDGLLVVVSRTIFGLHEPAGSGDAEDVEVVLYAATDEPALAIEAVGVAAGRKRAEGVEQRRARPVGAGVAGVDVGQHVRRDQIAATHAHRPGVASLQVASNAKGLILDRALHATELAVSEDTGNPARCELPVITGTDRAEPTVAALALIEAEDLGARDRVH